MGIGLTNLQPPIPPHTTLKNFHNFTIYILRKLRLPLVVNRMQHNSIIFYIARCTTLGIHFVYVLCTSCLMGIAFIEYKSNSIFVQQQPMTSCNISPTHRLHITHVAYQYQSKPYSQTPHFAFIYFTKNAAFPTNQSKPVFAKNAPIKKLTTKISKQTEFTMSRRLSAHNLKVTVR